MRTVLLAAISADGFIGLDASHLSTTWTTGSDKRLFMQLAKELKTMVMGFSTFKTTADKAPTVFTKSIPGRRLIVYTRTPAKVQGFPEVEATQESPKDLLNRLDSEGLRSVLIAGGGQVYRQFLQANLVDEMYLSVQPRVLGNGLSLLDKPHVAELELIDSQVVSSDSTVILHYRFANSA